MRSAAFCADVGGVVMCASPMQISTGHLMRLTLLIGEYHSVVSTTRADTRSTPSTPGGTSDRYPGSASGAVRAAVDPGGPTVATVYGWRPKRPRTASLITARVRRTRTDFRINGMDTSAAPMR